MINKIRKADTPESISKAADLLRSGGVIIHPTETLYGFAANALIPNAVRRIDDIKQRKFKETYIVLMRDKAMAQNLSIGFDRMAEKLAQRFWPGPLTLVLPIAKDSPLIYLAYLGTLAIRVSPDKFVEKLFRDIDFPIISTSVNKSGTPPLDNVLKMEKLFRRDIDLILERGVISRTVPSTIIAVRNNTVQMIRKGPISEEEIYGH
jgi:L-threonylcarbamoyladenylate synthase